MEEELEVLQSIYSDDLKILSRTAPLQLQVTLRFEDLNNQIVYLEFKITGLKIKWFFVF